MTVTSTTRRAGPYSGNGVTTAFPFTFKVFSTADVALTLTDADGISSALVLDTDYSIVLNPDQDTSPGGTIAYPLSGAPLATGETLVGVGSLPYDQTTDFPPGGKYRAQTVESAFDRTVQQIQQLAEVAGRSLSLPPGAATANTELPAPVATNVIGWNETADALVNYTPGDLATVVVAGTSYFDVFNGTGAQTAFVLTANPGSVNALDIAVDGVPQKNGIDFTVSGTTLTFTSAPAAGTQNIAVRYVAAVPVGSANAQDVTFLQAGTGAVSRSAQDELQERFSVTQFGARPGATAAVNTAAIQACINAAPEGSIVYFPGRYQINDELVVNKSLTLLGASSGPAYVRTSYTGLVQTDPTKACFKLVATTGMYAFGQYGVVGVRFVGMHLEGQSGSYGLAGIRCDTTVNGGDFHIRECLFQNISVRWFSTGVDLTGVAYLNNFITNSVSYCTTGVKIAKGAASDNGGQTRFIGGYYGLCTTGLSLNEDAASGSFSLHGVSVSENTQYGIRVHEESVFYMDGGCEIESNGTAGVYVEIKEANPNSSGSKTIQGKFLTNGVDVWVNKTTTAFSGGGFHWPMRIDNAYFADATALKVDVPGGHAPIDSPAFVIGRNVSGPAGPLASSQVSANFAGTDERKAAYTKRWVIPTSYVSGAVFAYLPPGLVVTSARMYFTANCSGFSSISLGDQANNSRYLSGINGQSVSLNTWQTATLALPQVVIDTTNNQLRVIGTGGWLTAAAVVEVQGYTT